MCYDKYKKKMVLRSKRNATKLWANIEIATYSTRSSQCGSQDCDNGWTHHTQLKTVVSELSQRFLFTNIRNADVLLCGLE